MQSPGNDPDRIQTTFDDHRLVANAGLLLPATLALHLGLPELVDQRLDLGRANPGDKVMTLVASALAGGDCIDDADVLHTGRTASANRSKGVRGPDQWKPEDRTYGCQYAVDWITIKSTWELTVTQQEHTALVQLLNTCAKRPELMVSHQSQVKQTPGPTSNPVRQTPTPEMRTYNSCDAAQAAGETRVQGSKGNGRGFPKWMVPRARDGDGDGVVCER